MATNQQISAAEALSLASHGPQESPITPAPGASEFQQKFEISEIFALLKEIKDGDCVYVYYAYDTDSGSPNYRWLNGTILGSRSLNPTEIDTNVDPNHVEFLTTMNGDSTQVYLHQISASHANEIMTFGAQSNPQRFHVSAILALLATIESEQAGAEQKWMYVYYAYNDDPEDAQYRWLKSVVLSYRPLSSNETNTAKDPFTVEFLDHTNEYPMP